MRLSRRAFKPHRNQRYRPYRGSDFDRDFGCNPAMQPTLRRLREAQLEPLLIIGAGAALIVGVLWLTVLLLVVTWAMAAAGFGRFLGRVRRGFSYGGGYSQR